MQLEAQTEKYQQGLERATSKLEGFQRKQTATLATIEQRFAKFGTLLRGGGFLAAFTLLERKLADVADKFKDTSPAAKSFAEATERIGEAMDRKFLAILEAAAPLLEKMEKYLSPTEVATRELEGATEQLAIRQRELNEAVKNGASLQSAYGKALVKRVEEAKQAADKAKGALGKAAAGGYAGEAAKSSAGFDMTEGFYNTQGASSKVLQGWQAAAAKEEEARQRRLADLFNERLEEQRSMQDAYDKGVAASEANRDREDQRLWESWSERRQEAYKAAEEQQKRLDDQAAAFSETFVDNLQLAADGGFKAVVESWVRTLEQMFLKTQASKFFNYLLTNFGGSSGIVGSVLGAFGFGGERASGGPVMAGMSYLVGEQGPEIFTPHAAGNITPNGAGGIVQNINVDARNASDPGMVVAAVKVATARAKAESRDEFRRGR